MCTAGDDGAVTAKQESVGCAVIFVTDCGTLGRNPPKRMGGGKGYKMRQLPSAVPDDEASGI